MILGIKTAASSIIVPPTDKIVLFIRDDGKRCYKDSAGTVTELDGTDGNTILYGSGPPDSGDGVDGDFYIDEATWTIYGPKTGGVWASGNALSNARDRRYDQFSDTVAYTGIAYVGSLDSAPVWSVHKLTFNSAGGLVSDEVSINNPTTVWNDRTTETYT